MKKFFVLLAAALFVSICVADVSWSAITGTDHVVAGLGDQGACSACHIPHKAVGNRLWPADMTGLGTDLGEVGQLCFYCHGFQGGANLSAAVQNNVTQTAVGGRAEFAHKRLVSAANIGGGNAVGTSTLPYAANASIECTSCHDVHDDTNRPFLRKPIDVLCIFCHSGRAFVNGTESVRPAALGAWGGAAYLGAGNPGAHPVGTDVASDVGGNSPILIDTAFASAKLAAGVHGWNLGGHRTGGDTGGVTCTTCHAPHGQQLESVSPDGGTGANYLLLIFNQAGTTGDGFADGNALPRNAECEGCHVDGASGTFDNFTGVAYAGLGFNVNPGNTIWSHPVDDAGAQYGGSVPNGATFPAPADTWPVGSDTAANNMDPKVICESCHTPHGLINNNRASTIGRIDDANYIIAPANTHILRNTEQNICGNCHTTTLPGHHPVGDYAPARFATPAAAGTANHVGNNTSPLTCGDCHNGTGAHNWTVRSGAGLDPDWIPLDNGRNVLGTRASENNVRASETCEFCHTANTGSGAAHWSPTSNAGTDVNLAGVAALSGRVRGSYQDAGEGTHMLGLIEGTMVYAAGRGQDNALFNATTQPWTPARGGNNGWSRFDGVQTDGHVVCESCHDVEPDKNTGGVNGPMLLGTYREGSATDPSGFCEGCHSGLPGGPRPHPMTGDNVSRAQLDPAESTKTLLVSGRFSRASTAWLSPYSTTPNAGANGLNCDSCHQPHDTPTAGGSYIYDAPSTNVTATTVPAAVAPHPPKGITALGLDDMAYCNQCHTY